MKIRCQICGSTNITTTLTQESNYNMAKGIAGGLLIPGGSIMGLEKKNVSLHICQDCGLDSTGTLAPNICLEIDEALRSNDVAKLRRFKKFYKNIEWDENSVSTQKSNNLSEADNVHYESSHKEDSPAPIIEKKIVFSGNVNVDSLLKRVFMFLEDGEFENANEYCEQILNQDPENPQAYLGKLLAYLRLNSFDALEYCLEDYEQNSNYKKLVRFADDALKSDLDLIKASNERRKELINIYSQRQELAKSIIVCRSSGVLGLKQDGTVLADGDNDHGQFNVENWTRVVKIAGDFDYTVGLREDGSLIGAGQDELSQTEGNAANILWCDSSAIIESTKDNRVNLYPLMDWITEVINVDGWRSIVSFCNAGSLYIGLCEDGSIKTTGTNCYNEWNDDTYTPIKKTFNLNTNDWRNISKILGSEENIFALRQDGTVIASGSNKEGICDINEWNNIIDIAAGYFLSGLRSDGTVVTTCKNVDLTNWNNIVAIASEEGSYIFGLKEDGTVVVAGNANCSVSKKVLEEYRAEVEHWKDIIAIVGGFGRIVGLKKDGTLVISDVNMQHRCDLKGWRLFKNLDSYEKDRTIAFEEQRRKEEEERKIKEEKRRKEEEKQRKAEEERKRQEKERIKAEQERLKKEEEKRRKAEEERKRQQALWRESNLCQYCGGEFKGLIFKKCSKCGTKKDY